MQAAVMRGSRELAEKLGGWIYFAGNPIRTPLFADDEGGDAVGEGWAVLFGFKELDAAYVWYWDDTKEALGTIRVLDPQLVESLKDTGERVNVPASVQNVLPYLCFLFGVMYGLSTIGVTDEEEAGVVDADDDVEIVENPDGGETFEDICSVPTHGDELDVLKLPAPAKVPEAFTRELIFRVLRIVWETDTQA